jgi:flagellar motor switch protein FliM
VKLAEVEIVANLAHTTMTLEQILAMREGDVIPIEIAPRILATVDGVPVMECRYGISNGQYALRVERLVSPADAL